jgi:hypothetical protein
MAIGDKHVLTGDIADGAYLTVRPASSSEYFRITSITSEALNGTLQLYNNGSSTASSVGFHYGMPLNLTDLNFPITYGNYVKVGNSSGANAKIAVTYEIIPGPIFEAFQTISGGGTYTCNADSGDEVRVVYIGMGGFPSTVELTDGTNAVDMPNLGISDIYSPYASIFNVDIFITGTKGLIFTNTKSDATSSITVLGYKTKDV